MTDDATIPSPSALAIDPARLEADFAAINAIGQIDGQAGINRISFSDADMAGRRWLLGRLEDAGLETRMDTVGNVFGRWPVGTGPAVLAGSHLDSVPAGGRYDGTLGVLAALEAVRAMTAAGITPLRPVEVVCTADEEGRFGGMLGSQVICGEVGAPWIDSAVDDSGLRLAEALRRHGLDPSRPEPRDPADIAVFLELHIEQGPVLADAAEKIGIVTAVSGVFNWTVTLTGAVNHSGTTPMDMRKDAFRGLADFGAAIPAILAEAGTAESRLTVGKVTLAPNFPHSIAGQSVFSIIGRDPDEAVMRDLAEACRTQIERAAQTHGLAVGIAEQSWLPPTALDGDLAAMLAQLAEDLGLPARRMVSGAGHDAQTFARHVPAGLIFVPSQGGISHAPDEYTPWSELIQGARLFAHALAACATR